MFNWYHPLKKAIFGSIFIGSVINAFFNFSEEIYKVCETDSQFASKLRLHYQKASYNNMFLPFFKNETLRVVKQRESSQIKEKDA